MPSFDVISKTDSHELTNAIDQTNRELKTRFDFKDTNARLEQDKNKITLIAPSDFQLKQIDDIFRNKLAKRQIDVRMLSYKDAEVKLNEARQDVEVKQGINTELAKKIVKLIKESNLKLQGAIQGDQVRITGKKKDDLQEAITLLRNAKLDQPLQFENFRD